MRFHANACYITYYYWQILAFAHGFQNTFDEWRDNLSYDMKKAPWSGHGTRISLYIIKYRLEQVLEQDKNLHHSYRFWNHLTRRRCFSPFLPCQFHLVTRHYNLIANWMRKEFYEWWVPTWLRHHSCIQKSHEDCANRRWKMILLKPG